MQIAFVIIFLYVATVGLYSAIDLSQYYDDMKVFAPGMVTFAVGAICCIFAMAGTFGQTSLMDTKYQFFSYHREISAYEDGDLLGYIQWSTSELDDIGEILDIWVRPDKRRQGIASELLDQAKQEDNRIHHSHNRTPLGQLWAMSTGDKLPRWNPQRPYSEKELVF